MEDTCWMLHHILIENFIKFENFVTTRFEDERFICFNRF